MATRLRLQRHGKKGKPFFHIVAADARANATVVLSRKSAHTTPTPTPLRSTSCTTVPSIGLQVGAEMSHTARAIMKYKGVVYHNHLLNGVKKGALTEEQAQSQVRGVAA